MSGDPAARPKLCVWGFMGSGKSTVARLVAEAAEAPLCDLDRAIEARAGASIERIFAEQGEPAFRRLERQLLLEQLDAPGRAVIALGGGALLDPEARARALAEAYVVTLEVSVETIAARTAAGGRPLLVGDERARREAIARLLSQREALYAEAHARLDGERPAEEVARDLAERWRSAKV